MNRTNGFFYWRWPERDLAGNAIDFFMRVLLLTRQPEEPGGVVLAERHG